MPIKLPDDVGPVYDLVLATRDGSTLSCKNSAGQTVLVSQIGFMTSVSPSNQQHEETELQHKDQLIQFGTSALIDREFEQWPQVTQGDWSGGSNQRVYGGSTADPTRFWAGVPGLLWPPNDFIPQQPFLSTPLNPASGTLARWVNPTLPGTGNPGFSGGFQASDAAATAAPGEGFLAMAALAASGPQAMFWTNGSALSVNAPFGAGVLPYDIIMDTHGYGKALASPDNVNINLYQFSTSGGVYNAAVLANFTNILSAGIVSNARLAAGLVGGNAYVAAAVTFKPSSGSVWVNKITLYNVGTSAIGAVDLQLPVTAIGTTSGPPNIVSQMAFLGDQLVFVVSDSGGWLNQVPVPGSYTEVIGYTISSNTFTTLATLYGAPNSVAGAVAGALFIVTQNLDLYLLQGSSLQYITTLPPPSPFASSFFQWSVSRVNSFGPYALFAIAFHATATTNMDIYAYDVTRGRLFRIKSLSFSGINQLPQPGFQLGVFSFWQQAAVPSFNAYFNIAVPVDDISAQASLVQILHFGVQLSGQITALQGPTDIVSSLIDFTAASNKLYRQIVASFPKLPNDTNVSVTLQAWLDQNPDALAATPDFGPLTITGGPTTVGAQQLTLLINKMARKLVYELITTGGNVAAGAFHPATKPQSVAVMAATGWVQTLMLDLAANVQTNTKNPNETAWTRQTVTGQPGVDATVAYNFLRQLWRLKGGQVIIYLPNGDTGNWLIQDLHFDSPKPWAPPFRADQVGRQGGQFLATVKLREDI